MGYARNIKLPACGHGNRAASDNSMPPAALLDGRMDHYTRKRHATHHCHIGEWWQYLLASVR
jgi:hypothetical protein